MTLHDDPVSVRAAVLRAERHGWRYEFDSDPFARVYMTRPYRRGKDFWLAINPDGRVWGDRARVQAITDKVLADLRAVRPDLFPKLP